MNVHACKLVARSLMIGGLVFGLAGCGGGSDLSRTFGLTRDAPDEFTVTTRAPLSMPPDYSLRPPEPGAPRPQEPSTRDAAEAALAPDTVLQAPQAGGMTPGQAALLQQAGPAAPSDVRQKVNAEGKLDHPSRPFTDALLFWKPGPQPGTVVDATREAQRLRENSALGQPPVTGDTPIIQPKRDGGILSTLSNLF